MWGGKSSSRVSGLLTPDAALSQLLSGTGLIYSFTNANTVTVSQPAASDDSAAVAVEGSIMLGSIYVRGANGTWGPVDGIAADRTGTGSKTDAAVIDIPASVAVVTTDEMKVRGVEDLDGALNYTSGVMTNIYGADERYDFVAIRGFIQTNSGSCRDGLQMRIYNLTGGRVEPCGMERVEVLKGSTSTLYGTNNPGGLVNMITKRPLDYRFGETYATIGQDHLEFGADFGDPLDANGVWAFGNGPIFRSHGRYSDLDLLSKNIYAAGNQHPNVGRLAGDGDSWPQRLGQVDPVEDLGPAVATLIRVCAARRCPA